MTPIEAAVLALDAEFDKDPNNDPSSHQLVRAVIAAYTKAVSSEAVGHVAQKSIDMAKGELCAPVMMFFGPYSWSFGNEPYLTLFSAPPLPAVPETLAERYGIKTQADLDAFFAKVDAALAASPDPEAK
jgi:hypothetical protein